MSAKTQIIEELGERALVLPNLVEGALRANDRAKYFMSLFQACEDHAARPDRTAPSLRSEREASGETDAALDGLVDRVHATPEGAVFIPGAARLHDRFVESVSQMLAPLRLTGGADLDVPVETYERRLAALRGELPAIAADAIPAGYVERVTRAERNGSDSFHLLVMDLHLALNRIQSQLAERSLDGARVYRLADADEPLVKAFMRGVNETASLKFDHPGLGTTATRMGDQLVIQNDLGTTDAHVVVIHVTDMTVSLIYTDVHHARLEFFKALCEPGGIEWESSAAGAGGRYESLVGRRRCNSDPERRDLLALLGSRLVFLIDWNRARKRLARFVKKADAVEALRWAADHGYGHRAFLETGGERLIYSALERTAPPEMRFGARLDSVLGRTAALDFLQAVLRITSEALQQHRSLRLVRDEVQAELLDHLHEKQEGVLGLAADHAALIAALAQVVQEGLLQSANGRAGWPALATRAKQWESKADEIVSQARHTQRQVPGADVIGRLLPEADDAADRLEDVAFLMTLLPEPHHQDAAATLDRLARLVVSSAHEYVTCVEVARDIRRSGTRDDVRQFLIAVDRVITLEHESDEAERQATASMLEKAGTFRTLHVLSEVAQGLEGSVDSLARCALVLKDYVMSEMLVE